jgi:ankyrin repeat protein
MKYLKLFEDFEEYNPYDIMVMFPDERSQRIVQEIKKSEPNLDFIRDLITLGFDLDWQGTGDYFDSTPLDAGVDINWQDERNGGRSYMHELAYWGRIEIARILIDAGANMDLQDDNGETPLHIAARHNTMKFTQFLLDMGANPDIQDKKGWTPLHLALWNNRLKIARMLIGAGARTDIQDNEGRLPYELTDSQLLKNQLKP